MSGYIENTKVMRDKLSGLCFGFSGVGFRVSIEEKLNVLEKLFIHTLRISNS
jgi:hypothetical protein